MMMRSISWWEMSILNESSIVLPYVAASAVARSGATIVGTGRGCAATRVLSWKSAPAADTHFQTREETANAARAAVVHDPVGASVVSFSNNDGRRLPFHGSAGGA